MAKIQRFGVSLEEGLLKRFDEYNQRKGYRSRSEAFRDLIREKLVEEEWQEQDRVTVGVLSLVYNHETRELTETLNKIQHDSVDTIVSSTHIHLDHHNCLEVIILKGRSGDIRKISDRLLSTRSVKDGKLLTTTTGIDII